MIDQGLITPPLGEDRIAKIPQLRADIDSLNPERRAWTLMALAAPYLDKRQDAGPGALASADDLVAAAQQIPRPVLLEFIFENQIDSPDPDIRTSDQVPFGPNRVRTFLLFHAAKLLEAGDADRLLAHEQRLREENSERGLSYYVDPSWATAAADLQPARATEILHAAFERFASGDKMRHQDQRCFLAQALCRHQGEEADAFLLDWFFGEMPEPTAYGFGRHRFAKWLGKNDQTRFIKAIFSDRRAVDLDWTTFHYVGWAANVAADRPLIHPEQIRKAEIKFRWSFPKEGKKAVFNVHPAPESERQEILMQWREAVLIAFP